MIPALKKMNETFEKKQNPYGNIIRFLLATLKQIAEKSVRETVGNRTKRGINMHDYLLFIFLPYTAVTVLIVVSIYRFVTNKFSYSSLSSQFLEGDELFYGSVPWHIGIIGVLTGHLIGLLIPKQVLWFNSVPIRLYILEVTGLVFGLLALVGVVSLFWRRVKTAKIWAVTTVMDMVVLVLLLAQVFLGVYTALFYRWGSSGMRLRLCLISIRSFRFSPIWQWSRRCL